MLHDVIIERPQENGKAVGFDRVADEGHFQRDAVCLLRAVVRKLESISFEVGPLTHFLPRDDRNGKILVPRRDPCHAARETLLDRFVEIVRVHLDQLTSRECRSLREIRFVDRITLLVPDPRFPGDLVFKIGDDVLHLFEAVGAVERIEIAKEDKRLNDPAFLVDRQHQFDSHGLLIRNMDHLSVLKARPEDEIFRIDELAVGGVKNQIEIPRAGPIEQIDRVLIPALVLLQHPRLNGAACSGELRPIKPRLNCKDVSLTASERRKVLSQRVSSSAGGFNPRGGPGLALGGLRHSLVKSA